MLFHRLIRVASLSALIISPVSAQFGIAGNKRKQTHFQELQEVAKQQAEQPNGAGASGGDMASMLEGLMGSPDEMAKMQEMWTEALKDPEAMKQFEGMGEQFAQALDQLTKMSPAELEKQMKDALSMLTEGSMVDAVIEKRDEIIKQLEATQAVPPEELAKFKADPEYFELKMRESFDQMQGLFNNPEYLKMATEAMGGMKEIMDNPQVLTEAFEGLKAELTDDTKIEEARLTILKGDNPAMSALFQSDEMQAILKDPEKWKATVKEGYKDILKDEL